MAPSVFALVYNGPSSMKTRSLTFAVGMLMPSLALAGSAIPAAEAKAHIGQTATVCGKVVTTRYLERTQKQPTFLNFDRAYPDHSFTAVIFGPDRAKFGKPEEDYLHKDICVTGKIEEYRGKPETVVTDPKQIRAQK
jgi:DNA/RNA endonuclease YhcR with UshA esterase domain